jgi:uncharacterized HAD superfamily protein
MAKKESIAQEEQEIIQPVQEVVPEVKEETPEVKPAPAPKAAVTKSSNKFVRILQRKPSHISLLMEDGSTVLVKKNKVDFKNNTVEL